MSTFSDLQRNSPKYPKETCPQIDKARKELVAERGKIQDLLDNLETEVEGWLEDLRESNGALRDNATYWRESCEELSARVDDLENENVTLLLQVEDLKSEIRSMERE